MKNQFMRAFQNGAGIDELLEFLGEIRADLTQAEAELIQEAVAAPLILSQEDSLNREWFSVRLSGRRADSPDARFLHFRDLESWLQEYGINAADCRFPGEFDGKIGDLLARPLWS